MKPPDKLLSVISQTLILDLGRTLESLQDDVRIVGTRQEPSHTVAEQLDAIVARIVQSIGEDVAVRGMLGIRPKMDSMRRRMRVCVVAYISWQHLRHGNNRVDIGDLASAIADPSQPVETLLHARHEIGLMIADKVIIGVFEDGRAAFAQVVVPIRTLVWLSGGADSLGFLTYQKAAKIPQADDERSEGEASPQGLKAVPTVKELVERVRVRVIGCDQQLKTLASRIVLAVTRAELLARGDEDTGVGVQVIFVCGESGSGKTFAVQELARASNLKFVSMDASTITGDGWAGAKAEDIFKGVCYGKVDKADKRPIIFCFDEIDKILRGSAEHLRSAQSSFLRAFGGETITVGGKRMMDTPPTEFSCKKHIYICSGTFDGLLELMKQGKGRTGIGFQNGVEQPQLADFRKAMASWGCIDEICNRASACVQMPLPCRESIAASLVAGSGIVAGFNKVLEAKNIVLLPKTTGVDLLCDYAVQTRTFYRGVKHLLGTIVEEILFDGTSGMIGVDEALVRRAIDRSNGDADNEVSLYANKTNEQERDDECEDAPLASVG